MSAQANGIGGEKDKPSGSTGNGNLSKSAIRRKRRDDAMNSDPIHHMIHPPTKVASPPKVERPKTSAEASSNWAKFKLANAGVSSYGTPNPVINKNQKLKLDELSAVLSAIPKEHLNKFRFPWYTHYGQLKYALPDKMAEEFFRKTKAIAIDCEMVEIECQEDCLARVSVVNEFGFCLYDSFVKPRVPVVDYRTQFSGVRKEDLENAPDIVDVRKKVAELMQDSVVVGHALDNDFSVLQLRPPKTDCRDTARFFKSGGRTPSLKILVKRHLDVDFQDGEHSSIEDAQAAMKLYLKFYGRWQSFNSTAPRQNISAYH